MWICGEAALQNPKEKARQMILNFDEEVVWSSFDHYNLPVLHREKNYIPSVVNHK